MTAMTPEAATALRKPFPPESVGVLPKPYKKESPRGQCNECGGWHGLPAIHLDYVGHAAVTDRLLTVDPEWSWEFALHRADGTPVLNDGEGNLWIRLTICGITRLGVGDGSSAKERIGDAIRNAAMRFGVALDLWAKENLVEFAQYAGSRQADPQPPAPQPDLAPTVEGDLISDAQQRKLGALMREANITVRADALLYVNDTIGRPVASRSELSKHEASMVIESLNKDLGHTEAGDSE